MDVDMTEMGIHAGSFPREIHINSETFLDLFQDGNFSRTFSHSTSHTNRNLGMFQPLLRSRSTINYSASAVANPIEPVRQAGNLWTHPSCPTDFSWPDWGSIEISFVKISSFINLCYWSMLVIPC